MSSRLPKLNRKIQFRLESYHSRVRGGRAIRKVRARFVALCRQLDLFAEASVANDGSKR
jgi:hypothetical protein